MLFKMNSIDMSKETLVSTESLVTDITQMRL